VIHSPSSKATCTPAQPTVRIWRIGLTSTDTKAGTTGKIAAAWELIARAACTQWSFMMVKLYAATSASHGGQPPEMSFGRVYRYQAWTEMGGYRSTWRKLSAEQPGIL
jgi:hypothetical protein